MSRPPTDPDSLSGPNTKSGVFLVMSSPDLTDRRNVVFHDSSHSRPESLVFAARSATRSVRRCTASSPRSSRASGSSEARSPAPAVSLTKTPWPCEVPSRPSPSSYWMPRWTVIAATPYRSASARPESSARRRGPVHINNRPGGATRMPKSRRTPCQSNFKPRPSRRPHS